MPDLDALGWDDGWEDAFSAHRADRHEPARVAVRHRGAYDVLAASGEHRSRVASRLRRGSARAELPVVGDWVALDDRRAIVAVLPRRTAITRHAAHTPRSGVGDEQVIAANVDAVLVAFALGQEPDLRMLERYLVIARDSGARPAVVLTKADLDPDAGATSAGVARALDDVPVVSVSAQTGVGLDDVRAILAPGTTGALLGPSGAGKSTLANALLDDARLATGEVAADGSGRHTTTRRELVAVPGGGLLIDNPGMRTVQPWLGDIELSDVFEDVTALAPNCRFADCRHETEPGCAVLEAVERGDLPTERVEAFRALRAELEEHEAAVERRERSRARRAPGAGAG